MNKVNKNKQLLFWLVFFIGLIFILWVLKDVLFPFVIAMILSYVLDPLVDRVEKWRISRTIATVMVMLLGICTIIMIILLIIPLLHTQFSILVAKIPHYTKVIQEQSRPLIEYLLKYLEIEEVTITSLRETITNYFGDIVSWIGKVFSGLITGGLILFDILMILVVTPVVTFYLLRDWNRLMNNIEDLFPQDYAPTIRTQCQEVHRTLMKFIYGQSLICLILAIFYSLLLWMIGLDFAFLIGFISGVISFIPYIGSLFGLLMSVSLAYLQFGDFQFVLMTLGIFLCGNFIEGYILQPKLVGTSIGLHPVSVIFALIAGGHLLGFLGILLAVPVTAMIGVLARFALQQYRVSVFFISHKVKSPSS